MISRLTKFINELSSLGKVLTTEEQVDKVPRILPQAKWDIKVIDIREAKDISIMTLDALVGNRRTYEMNMDDLKKEQMLNEKSMALKVSDEEEFDLDDKQMAFLEKNFKKFLRKGKGNERKETSTKKWSNEKSQFGCYKCGKIDHHIKDCPQWEIKWRKERAEKERTAKQKEECAMIAAWGSGTEESNSDLEEVENSEEECAEEAAWGSETEESETNETSLMAAGDSNLEEEENYEKFECMELKSCKTITDEQNSCLKKQVEKLEYFNLDLKSEVLKMSITGQGKEKLSETEIKLAKVKGSKHWYMDSACSKHMTGDKYKFLSLIAFKGGSVSFGDGKKGTIVGVEKIGKSKSKALEEVYYVNMLKHNLFNISQLCDKGNKVIFTSEGCRVEKLDTKEVVLTAKRHRNVYKVDIMGMSGTTLKCLNEMANDPLLWHKRLGHASLKQINK
ncbi:uncharacterized protein LOC125827660 [Solanum verrucosum]|uniref:uncharacterized protein LOC125827660 n=1 Tax=Solanum verrucosum TaxID=315347 RepID=UPI0020D0F1CD|nr:uncharacterized protein LOC125827660 [Solanum verrucosum]